MKKKKGVSKDETGEREEQRDYYTTEQSRILLIPLSPVITMLHPRVVQRRMKEKKRKQKTEKRMYCSESAGTRELIKRMGMVWHVCWAMNYTTKRLESRSLTRKERKKATAKDREGGGASKQSEGAKRNTDQSQPVHILPQSFHPTCRATRCPDTLYHQTEGPHQDLFSTLVQTLPSPYHKESQ